jgi:hypothetical protein
LATKLKGGRPKEHNHIPKTKYNGATPAHTRSELRRERGRDKVFIDEKSPHGVVGIASIDGLYRWILQAYGIFKIKKVRGGVAAN